MGRLRDNDRKYRVPALEKGLDILDLLAHALQPMILAEISKGLGKSSSEVFRIVDCLEKRGYLIKDAVSDGYRLSLRLYQLAHVHPPVEELLRAANVPMQRLAARIRESCHLSVMSGGDILVLAEWPSPEKIRIAVEAGTRLSPLQTVSGRLLVAHLAPDEREEFLGSCEAYQALSDHKKREYRKTLETIRERGYAESPSEVHVGILDLCVPVGDPQTRILAALAVARWKNQNPPSDRDLILESMLHCARRITRSVALETTQGET